MTRQQRKIERNDRRTVNKKCREKGLEGGDGQAAYVRWCRASKNPNNEMAENPRKRKEV